MKVANHHKKLPLKGGGWFFIFKFFTYFWFSSTNKDKEVKFDVNDKAEEDEEFEANVSIEKIPIKKSFLKDD